MTKKEKNEDLNALNSSLKISEKKAHYVKMVYQQEIYLNILLMLLKIMKKNGKKKKVK